MKSQLKCILVPGTVIVGAGPSGLATAACLKEKGIPSLILEREICLASLWKLKAYDCLKVHLPRKFCELPHMKLPPDFPAFPSKLQFISYLDAYAKRFSIEPMFGEEVLQAEYDSVMGFWRVQTLRYRFFCRWLIVATGENAEPILPEIPGISDFQGRCLHSSLYKNGANFKGEKTLVVGCGNSGMEISLDLCNNGAQPFIVVRDKLHILPKEMLGRSTFDLSMWLLKWLPLRIVDRFLVLCSWLILGDTRKFGLRRPQIGPLELKKTTGKTPVLNVGTLAKIRTGQIKVVPGIHRLTARGAEFVNGGVAEFDSVILATGYRSNVPSWLKDEELFNKHDGSPKTPFPNCWKGKNGLYSVGFGKQGLKGASIDAQTVAQDIARQWKSETKHLRFDYHMEQVEFPPTAPGPYFYLNSLFKTSS
ncbi:indole-3-pyruvate monooxygenase YUCCA6-like [Macadamia integrifolia]|uniref:indole-3-pyruvate monooxygenase YUCCA6-like n=1 Tax=Macadamia integrifolia TaxID=60698 RepID=UPI001C4F897E|nr:indole-3-pyruvate monooxygenase YUCCA6-like [Macadamia integrifolia]XP_042492101.1 indole-3-pyruvate monooxygenase YUCCA6-like [Macadamia integrifolia]XP_042492102.1 indole-3-pyruvate monooxygenase YUCCA6-like [Macadamia integrifolia]